MRKLFYDVRALLRDNLLRIARHVLKRTGAVPGTLDLKGQFTATEISRPALIQTLGVTLANQMRCLGAAQIGWNKFAVIQSDGSSNANKAIGGEDF